MVINSSRVQTAMLCWRKAFNQQHRRLAAPRTSFNLIDGSGFHEGVAHGLASKDWSQAEQVALAKFEEDLPKAGLLPEEFYTADQHRSLVRKMLSCYRDNYEHEQYQVIQPECEFEVALPGSEHSCVFLHHWELTGREWVEHWGPPSAEAILEKRVRSHRQMYDTTVSDRFQIYPQECSCWQPHRVKGKTDAVVMWTFGGSRGLWLLEHKTTAISGQQFWNQWLIDLQPTVYLYGIWKALGIKPSGFILNAINKPSEAQVSNWNSRRKYGQAKGVEDYISYERQAFLRTEEDLLRCEQQLKDWCDEWEWRVTNGKFPLSNIRNICFSYNRACDYYTLCLSHDQPSEFENFGVRSADYIDVRIEELAKAGQGAQ